MTLINRHTSINLADELVISLLFVHNEHFVNAVTMGKVSHVDKMRMQTLRFFRSKSNKNIIRAYPYGPMHGGHSVNTGIESTVVMFGCKKL